ncbi:protein AATF-like [Mizuhopecten yessoensis]|uniref:Protein AATF n=1 Tax=Mizuhopecten yessoensis TaxID=6573 RepID=A0A210QPS7_MIZYE|nr:protein AATF-like [Mizuhopecten yessoensis]OWF50744.1 Protein AATF [Mizuhopecten yessoensis]
MAALREALALLTNPAPVFQDPEDNEDDTNAKLVSKSVEDEEDAEEASQVSTLRKKAALTTADLGEKYAGKKTSRNKLSQFGESDDELESDDENEEDFEVEDNEMEDGNLDSESESENNDEDDEDDEDIKSFQNKLTLATQSPKSSFSFADDGDFSKYADMDEDDGEEGEDESDEDDEDDDSEENEGYSDEEDMEESLNDNEGEITKFSKADTDLEVEKGNAAKSQLGVWDSLLENRIKVQKVVGLVNQLPQPDTWGTFEDHSERGDNFTQTSLTAQASLQNLLDKLLQLQTVLLLQNTETRHIATGTDASTKSSKEKRSGGGDNDEEITSESETEEAEEDLKSLIQKTGVKRKHTLDEYSETLTKRHKDFLRFRNTAIQKWYDRTRLVSGKVNSKSFRSFDQSALKQIEQILGDKERLIKRTQLKRSVFRVLGTVEKTEQEETKPDNQNSTDMENLKNYDQEIFDDSDYYHQQLRELIERKAADTNNPVALSRHWLEIQKMRKKVKKNVDTKASKGRKTRYEIHKKLVNFMAPEDRCLWTDESRDDLFKSLFGKRFQQPPSEADNSNAVK